MNDANVSFSIIEGETVDNQTKTSNRLINETSPYLRQHAYNPVDWYPWSEEAFEKAKAEDKPIFLSIGYSTCHWCHVMAHESFEDEETAKLLNKHFVSIKVDKEERPDIDSIYMSVCQAYTGSGGWPMSIFMTPEQRPFFAGTYFPPDRRFNSISFKEVLTVIKEKWDKDREQLLQAAEKTVNLLKQVYASEGDADSGILQTAVSQYKHSYDSKYGGFGDNPKFPAPHNLLFLLTHYEKSEDKASLEMVEKTLIQMYRGGMFDHIGYGFSRYSTDRFFLVPHFEKMLYDNALLILAYCKAYESTEKAIYKQIAENTAFYIMREMTSEEGGFYCAQDADSEGEEGKYYVFKAAEIIQLLGEEEGTAFNEYYDITERGNFEGKNIPNLLKSDHLEQKFKHSLPRLYEYRKQRYRLHLDDKILTSWNSLMIAALCRLYRITENEKYLKEAEKAKDFIEKNLCEENTLFVSCRGQKRGTRGFLDDYANYIFALLELYEATLQHKYLERARELCKKVITDFGDEENGGFYLYGEENESLIMRPKETYDGAMPSGNSMMAYNLVRLNLLSHDSELIDFREKQINFMCAQSKGYPPGYAMFLVALSYYLEPPAVITVVKKDNSEQEEILKIPFKVKADSIVRILEGETKEYPLKDDKTTYYICKNHRCMPPSGSLF